MKVPARLLSVLRSVLSLMVEVGVAIGTGYVASALSA
jgi:hypothetical protein